jgi:hypothetical protein
MGTEDNQRFVREKVRAWYCLSRSDAYKRRFGSVGPLVDHHHQPQRLLNMKRQTESAVAALAACFTSRLCASDSTTILTEPIWLRGGDTALRPLLRP